MRAKAAARKPREQTIARRASGGDGGTIGEGTSRAAAESLYLAELQRAIAKRRFYPDEARRRNREGAVTVSFVILADGRITQIRVTRSSGWDSLDGAAVRALENLGRFKPIPDEIDRTRWALRVPINFALR
jgi:protein TonB